MVLVQPEQKDPSEVLVLKELSAELEHLEHQEAKVILDHRVPRARQELQAQLDHKELVEQKVNRELLEHLALQEPKDRPEPQVLKGHQDSKECLEQQEQRVQVETKVRLAIKVQQEDLAHKVLQVLQDPVEQQVLLGLKALQVPQGPQVPLGQLGQLAQREMLANQEEQVQ